MWWRTVTRGRGSEGGNWQMQWVANTTSHYLGTWCIQHYYRWCAHLGCQQSTELTPPGRFKWTGSFRPKDEIWFLRVCHHISNAVYHKIWTLSIRILTVHWFWGYGTEQRNFKFVLTVTHSRPYHAPREVQYEKLEIRWMHRGHIEGLSSINVFHFI